MTAMMLFQLDQRDGTAARIVDRLIDLDEERILVAIVLDHRVVHFDGHSTNTRHISSAG